LRRTNSTVVLHLHVMSVVGRPNIWVCSDNMEHMNMHAKVVHCARYEDVGSGSIAPLILSFVSEMKVVGRLRASANLHRRKVPRYELNMCGLQSQSGGYTEDKNLMTSRLYRLWHTKKFKLTRCTVVRSFYMNSLQIFTNSPNVMLHKNPFIFS